MVTAIAVPPLPIRNEAAKERNVRPQRRGAHSTPSRPVFCPNTPVFAGLTPGYVGLYQVNFVIPGPPPGTACAPPIANNPTIVSNLGLTLVGSTSFDGAGICVEVGSGVP
jgi:hypothetical protein